VADALLILHSAFIAFVVLGLVAIYLGLWRDWSWVRNLWFRLVHLIAIGFVVFEVWFGMICPLTTWEMRLRARSGDITYEGSFIQHWLQTLIYYDLPDWVFIVAYTLFGALVLASWFIVPPKQR
jgi:polyferredoxin